jgi:hypothetical protein
MDYDPATRRLTIGELCRERHARMWAYEVSGREVLRHWFSYRRRDLSRPIIGDRGSRHRSAISSPTIGCRNTPATCSTFSTCWAG